MRDTLAPRPYLRRGVAHKELHSPPIARSEPFDRHRAAPGLGRGDQRALDLWLPRTSNVLRRLRLRAFSDSLQACGRSSSRYFTRSDFWSSRAPCCPWRSCAPTPIGHRPSIAAPASSLHVSRSNPVGVALAGMGRLALGGHNRCATPSQRMMRHDISGTIAIRSWPTSRPPSSG